MFIVVLVILIQEDRNTHAASWLKTCNDSMTIIMHVVCVFSIESTLTPAQDQYHEGS